MPKGKRDQILNGHAVIIYDRLRECAIGQDRLDGLKETPAHPILNVA